MAYKGSVRAGSSIQAKLLLDHTASDTANLFIAASQSGGQPVDDSDTVAPGGSASVAVTPATRGRLEIAVDMALESDTALLIVTENGAVKNREPITGDTDWAYTLLPPAGGGA
jgi:hypothetical protein